jgi:hypothetical protein
VIGGLTPSILCPWLAVAPTYSASVAGSRTDARRGGSWWVACSAVRMDVAGGRGSPAAWCTRVTLVGASVAWLPPSF